MLCLEIAYLPGSVVSHDPEWPPTPSWLLGELISSCSREEIDQDHLSALSWLQEQAPVVVSGAPEAGPVRSGDTDDPPAPILETRRLGSGSPRIRIRTVQGEGSGADPVVQLIWPDASLPEPQLAALVALLERIDRIGEDGARVRCSLTEQPPGAGRNTSGDWPVALELEPEAPPPQLRSAPLESPLSPWVAGPQPLGGVRAAMPSALGEDWIVFRCVGGPRLPITCAAIAAQALKDALLSYAGPDPDPVLSGRWSDGGAGVGAAFVAIPSVGGREASGQLLGVAVLLPRHASRQGRRCVHEALRRWEASGQPSGEERILLSLTLRQVGVVEIERHEPRVVLGLLAARSWCRPSARWASATPVVLDLDPGELVHPERARAERARAQARATVSRAIVQAGHPEPVSVEIGVRPPLNGPIHVRHHPPFPDDGVRSPMAQVHTWITFGGPVAGPLLLGEGRHQGLGLLWPIPDDVAW